MKRALPLLCVLGAAIFPVHGAIIITEAAPWSSGNSPLGADWIEITNTGPAAVDLTGWRMDDESNSFALSVALRGVTGISAGQSIVFFEGNASGSTDATIAAAFNSVWGTAFAFGSTIGAYGGSGVGLSTGGDAVNIFNSSGVLQAGINFGVSPSASPFATFYNPGLLNNATISTLSVAGTNGAFAIVDSLGNTEIGSPGAPGASVVVPEPSTAVTLALGMAALALFTRRRDSRRTQSGERPVLGSSRYPALRAFALKCRQA